MELEIMSTYVRLDEKFFKLIPGLGDELVFIDIEMGQEHSWALTQDFQVFVWGWNEYGQLGLGDVEE